MFDLRVELTEDEAEAIRILFQKLDTWTVHDIFLDNQKSEQALIAIDKIKEALG